MCLEWTSQEGVRVENTGESNYDEADTIELGDVVQRQYMCRDCDTDIWVIDGVLIAQDPGDLNI